MSTTIASLRAATHSLRELGLSKPRFGFQELEIAGDTVRIASTGRILDRLPVMLDSYEDAVAASKVFEQHGLVVERSSARYSVNGFVVVLP